MSSLFTDEVNLLGVGLRVSHYSLSQWNAVLEGIEFHTAIGSLDQQLTLLASIPSYNSTWVAGCP